MCKSSPKKDYSPNTKRFNTQKLKENINNIKYNNGNLAINNNMKCINVNEIENEDNSVKNSMESYGDREYELCLKNALKEALDENEKVRKNILKIILLI